MSSMNLPVIVTVPRRKLHVVRFQIKVGKCGQRTGRWMVNTCHNILLNLVYNSLTRDSVVPSLQYCLGVETGVDVLHSFGECCNIKDGSILLLGTYDD